MIDWPEKALRDILELNAARRSVDELASRSDAAREGATEWIGDSVDEGVASGAWLRNDDARLDGSCNGSGRGVYAGDGPLSRIDRSRMWSASSSSIEVLRDIPLLHSEPSIAPGNALALRGTEPLPNLSVLAVPSRYPNSSISVGVGSSLGMSPSSKSHCDGMIPGPTDAVRRISDLLSDRIALKYVVFSEMITCSSLVSIRRDPIPVHELLG